MSQLSNPRERSFGAGSIVGVSLSLKQHTFDAPNSPTRLVKKLNIIRERRKLI